MSVIEIRCLCVCLLAVGGWCIGSLVDRKYVVRGRSWVCKINESVLSVLISRAYGSRDDTRVRWKYSQLVVVGVLLVLYFCLVGRLWFWSVECECCCLLRFAARQGAVTLPVSSDWS